MRVEIVKRKQLTEEQFSLLRNRAMADIDWVRIGLFANWLDSDSNEPVGLLYRGGPPTATTVTFWLCDTIRGFGIGNNMIDLFAQILKQDGVTGIAPIHIEPYGGQQNIASENLVIRLRRYFSNTDLG